MRFEPDFVGFAETAAIDPRGNLTISGFSPPYISVDKFPSQITPYFIVSAGSDELPEVEIQEAIRAGQANSLQGSIEIRVTSPDGEIVFFAQQPIAIATIQVRDIPARLLVVAQVSFVVGKPGKYDFRVVVNGPVSGDPVFEGTNTLRVIDSERLRPQTSLESATD